MRLFLTGANGFVGSCLSTRLAVESVSIVRCARRFSGDTDGYVVADLNDKADLLPILSSCEVVVHCAARVHIMNDKSAAPLSEFRRVNVDGTANLARQAGVAGVKRFVFLSSVKVNGEQTAEGQPFTADDVPAPQDAYGVSKYEAELVLRQIAAETGMEVVIIRPPLVYGPGVKANFASMMRWVARGVPLPLGAVTRNRRSFVALDNLVDLIVICLNHPAAANQTFLVSDGQDLSTAQLLQKMAFALGRPARLFSVPDSILKWGAIAVNKPSIYQRLCGSLQLDIEKTRQLLDWTPPTSVDEGLRRAVDGSRL